MNRHPLNSLTAELVNGDAQHGSGLGDALLRHGRVHPCGTDRVHRNPARGDFERQRLREADDPVLGGAIGRVSGNTKPSQHRRKIDDPAALPALHMSEALLGAQIRARQVRVQDRMPARIVRIGHGGLAGDPGIVHKNIEAPVPLHRLLNRGTDHGRVRHIHPDGQHVMAGGSSRILAGL